MAPIMEDVVFVEALSFFGTVKKETGDDERKPYQRKKSTARAEDKADTDDPQPSKKAVKRQIQRPDGTVVAGPRPIKRDYDSDDERLIQLKQMGHADTYVATQLAKEGRVKYNARTISGRWQRIRKVLEEKEEEQLDDELTDWHEGEDKTLEGVIQQVERKIQEEKDRLDARKWREVSQHFANVTLKRKYTANACEERWHALMTGTADLPIEQDPDKEGRARKREQRQLERQARRAMAAAEAQEVEDSKQRTRELIEESKAVKKEEAAQVRIEKEAARLEQRKLRNRIKNAGVAAKKQLIANKEAWLAYNRAEIAWEKAKLRATVHIRKHGIRARVVAKPGMSKIDQARGSLALSLEGEPAIDSNGAVDSTTAGSSAKARGDKRMHPDLDDEDTVAAKRVKTTA
ncbi:hypothetical protein B0A48_03683 [Cryoendolithus antarcticus]|uniref:Myb-like domain-containing protein n=1 Tax=Cryoendolithus antarcticus TaxID=1507870 RepID=A0A1V8TG77_9PEZI|nr:hypothetical protein B0A48_03683 [Cryoendolithus antarcticus]